AAQEAAAQEAAAQEAAAQEAAAQEAAAQEAGAEQAGAEQAGADEAGEDALLDQRAAAGAGALVLAGVLIGLAARRRAQQRRRKPGERLPAPSPQAQMTELEVRAAADGQGLADIDHAMRALGAHARATTTDLPQVRAVRLTAEEVQLYLAEAPEDLPAPWAHTESRTVWVLARGDVAQLPLDEGPAPYPSLVTLGRDTQDAQLLLDLEHICTLAVTDDGAGDVLRSLAVELAVSPWADNLTVTVVGFGQDLTQALDTPRLQHATDLEHLIARLTKRAEAITDLLADADVDDVAQARARGRGRDAHAPEIVLIDQPIPNDVRDRLQELVTALPRVGLAAVTSQDAVGRWQLRLNAAADEEGEGLLAHLEPADLYLRPEQLTEAECASLGALLATTDLAPVAGPSWASNLADELTLDDLPVHDPADDDQELDEHDDHGRGQDEQPAPQQGSVQAAAHLTPRHRIDEQATAEQDSGTRADVPGTVAGDLDVDGVDAAPEAATHVDEDVLVDVPQDHDDEPATPMEEARGASVHRLPPPRPTAPYVKVLGDVALTQCAGSPPKEPSKRGVLMALITYLALKPGAADNRVLAEALRPSKPLATNTVDAHASRARNWLGAAPDGEQYLPLKRDGGSYTLHPDVRTDWDDYLELVGQDAAATHTDRLLQALALVEGIPLAAPNAQHYAWAEPLRQEMVSSISDVAHEVARRAQLRGDLTTVRTAVAAAHRVDELDEHAWRDLLRAEHNAGHDDVVAGHADRVRTLAENIDVELDDNTEDLIEQLTAPHASARTAVAL
ncbi:bacterial transcriptional activator domain-containing protein, partial [uncultured Pseudokineococcus sp.]|uniref:bacterial transcriptional activator domain-containing protein n=1 Tax=uncultured Pseudokineococcus sp. TaxID=1642928 RepID=UPI00261B7727